MSISLFHASQPPTTVARSHEMPQPNRTTALDLWPESDHEEEISSNNHEEEQSAPSEEPDVERIDAVPRIPRKINRDGDKRTYTTHLVAHLASEYFDNVEVVENVPEVFVNVDSAERSRRLLRDKDYIQFIQSLMDKYREPARVTFDRRLAGRRIARRQVTVGTNVYNVSKVDYHYIDWSLIHSSCRLVM